MSTLILYFHHAYVYKLIPPWWLSCVATRTACYAHLSRLHVITLYSPV